MSLPARSTYGAWSSSITCAGDIGAVVASSSSVVYESQTSSSPHLTFQAQLRILWLRHRSRQERKDLSFSFVSANDLITFKEPL